MIHLRPIFGRQDLKLIENRKAIKADLELTKRAKAKRLTHTNDNEETDYEAIPDCPWWIF